MVTDQQVDHYQTFGLVVLAGYLDQRETADLGDELDRPCFRRVTVRFAAEERGDYSSPVHDDVSL